MLRFRVSILRFGVQGLCKVYMHLYDDDDDGIAVYHHAEAQWCKYDADSVYI